MPTAPRSISYRRTPRPERRPSAQQRGYTWRWRQRTAAWIQEQAALGNTRCAICHKPLSGQRRDIHVDHIWPPSIVGDPGSEAYQQMHDDEANWQMTCPSCNSRKQDKSTKAACDS